MEWRFNDRGSYSYRLGLYLGDGCLNRAPRTSQPVISCDARYPRIVTAAAEAALRTGLCRRAGCHAVRGSGCVRVVAASQRWPQAFPQHGPGRKHSRPIVLDAWQQAIVEEHPWPFLRGLLHSDGCRTVNRFATLLPSGRVADYAYPRWFFSNRSADIIGLFCSTCDAVGVRWTRSNERNISVSHRHRVALLDEWVGPKA